MSFDLPGTRGVCRRPFVVGAALLAAALTAPAEMVTLTPASDTFISEHWVGDNGGGADMVIGTQGTMSGSALNRGLVKFDFSTLPTGAQINSVTLGLTVVKSPATPASTFELRRLLRDWDEAGSTWENRTASEQWDASGGAEGTDYAALVSGTAEIGNVVGQSHTFASTASMVADVMRWMTNSAENFGWLIKTADEGVSFSARRIGASEGDSPPRLTIDYTAPEPRPVINSVLLNGGEVCVGFEAQAGRSYLLERRSAVDTGSWVEVAALRPAAADGPATLCDPLGTGNGFYRVGRD